MNNLVEENKEYSPLPGDILVGEDFKVLVVCNERSEFTIFDFNQEDCRAYSSFEIFKKAYRFTKIVPRSKLVLKEKRLFTRPI